MVGVSTKWQLMDRLVPLMRAAQQRILILSQSPKSLDLVEVHAAQISHPMHHSMYRAHVQIQRQGPLLWQKHFCCELCNHVIRQAGSILEAVQYWQLMHVSGLG